MAEKTITCEIVRPNAMLSENERGNTKEINLVSWKGGEPKYDIRDWHLGREKCGKGITLSRNEIQNLMEVLEREFEAGGETEYAE